MAVDLSAIEFTEADAPVDVPSDNDVSHCSVCGVGIDHLYNGRGRRPTKCTEHRKARAGGASTLGAPTSRGSGDVKQAVTSLEMGYNALAMGLMLLGARESAAALTASIPGLSAQNAQFLAQDKDLVKAINKVGKTGGRFGFFSAQALTIGPVAVMAVQELKEKAEAKRAADERAAHDAEPFAEFAGGASE